MLINGWSGSGGDAFPDYFREAGPRTAGRHAHLGRPDRHHRHAGPRRRRQRSRCRRSACTRRTARGSWKGTASIRTSRSSRTRRSMAKGVDAQLESGIAGSLEALLEDAPAAPSRSVRLTRSAEACDLYLYLDINSPICRLAFLYLAIKSPIAFLYLVINSPISVVGAVCVFVPGYQFPNLSAPGRDYGKHRENGELISRYHILHWS